MFDDGQGLTLRKQDNTDELYFYYDMTNKEKGGEIGARIDSWSMNWFSKNRTPDQMYQIMSALED